MTAWLRRLFPVGTRSVLWGMHNPLWHGPTVWLAYLKLYGREALSMSVVAACFLHDIGYWGKPNMDGPEGVEHPYLGARLMHRLFDRVEYRISYAGNESETARLKLHGWEPYSTLWEEWPTLWWKRRSTKWYAFAAGHSRSYAKEHGIPTSKLCAADKLAPAIMPVWFNTLVGSLSEEIAEYRANSSWVSVSNRDWVKYLQTYSLERVESLLRRRAA